MEPNIDAFHFPFFPEYGDAPTFFHALAKKHLGARVLELGAGSGWLKARWKIDDYVGIEQNDFGLPYQKQLREKALRNGVLLGTPVSAVTRKLTDAAPFDSIVCYESFHAFPNDAMQAALSPLLRAGGTLILVDGSGWWPKTLDWRAFPFKKLFSEEIPTERFDNKKVYDVTFRTLDALDRVVGSRAALVQVAGPMIDARVGTLMKEGIPIEEIRKMCPAPEFDADLRYGIFVFEKLSDDERRAWQHPARVSTDECRAWQHPAGVSTSPDDPANPNLERLGLYEDGWAGGNVSLALNAEGGRAQRLKIAGLVPLIDDARFETELTVSIDGHTVGQARLGLGTFTFERELPVGPGHHTLGLAFSGTQVLPVPDGRTVAARISFAGFKPP